MLKKTWAVSTAEKAAAGDLGGSEIFRIVQGGASKSLTVAALAAHMLATLAFDPAGSASTAQAAAIAAATSALSDHEADGNPHAQYLTQAEGDAAFDASGAAATAQAAAQSYTDTAINTLKGGVAAGFDTLAELASGKQDASANLSSWSALAPGAKQDAHANLTTLAGLASLTPLTRLAASGETVTVSSPLLDLAQTWNGPGVTFTGLKFNATDTASASGSLLADLQAGGVSKFSVRKDGRIDVAGAGVFSSGVYVRSNSAAFTLGQSDDVALFRDAANVLAQRNGTTAQAFRIYNTYTDASNYERLGLYWSGNTAFLEASNAGTGAARNLWLGTTGATSVMLYTAGTGRWQVNSSGHFIAAADNVSDIGANGATRPRKIYVATDVDAGGYVSCGNTSGLRSGRMRISTPTADGVVLLQNSGQTDFSRLQFGGTTSSFPALKRNANSIDVRLADDSGYAPLQAAYLYWTDNIGGCFLRAEAANTPAFRNGTSSQTLRLYNTYTDASNYERGFMRWAANVLEIGTENLGTGSARNLALYGQGTLAATIGSSSISLSGRHLLWASDNSQDIGASAANRPRTIYAGSDLILGGRAFVNRLDLVDGITAPAAVAGQARLYVDTADGDLKIIFGDGTIKTIVVDT